MLKIAHRLKSFNKYLQILKITSTFVVIHDKPFCLKTQIVRYAVYYVRYNEVGQTINKWIPSTISSAKIAYTTVGTPPCASTYTAQTVASNTTVTGCNNLNVQNVTVTNNSKLTLNAPGEVTINGPFEVQSGSQLDVKSP